MKKVLLRFMFAFLLFGMSGTYILANGNSKIEVRTSDVIPDTGSWVYRTGGQAKSDDTSSNLITRGQGYSNYYFKVFVRDTTDGVSVAEKDLSNGKSGYASVKITGNLKSYHNHTATWMLMS